MSWERFKKYYLNREDLGSLSLILSKVNFDDAYLTSSKVLCSMEEAFAGYDALEAGAIANPDENRMVGHTTGFARQNLLPPPQSKRRF